jgi:hypothetical protein
LGKEGSKEGDKVRKGEGVNAMGRIVGGDVEVDLTDLL